MANKSNWKGSEAKAALLFPGARRRTRVGGGTYALLADDIVWGPEVMATDGKSISKMPMFPGAKPIYIDVKKRARIALVTEFKKAEKKYKGCLILIAHKKNDSRQFVLVDDEFFSELIAAWCKYRELKF